MATFNPARPSATSPSIGHLWGIDLGGTKIEGVILDPSRPDQALHRLRVPTEAAQG